MRHETIATAADAKLQELVELAVARLQAGESIELAELAHRHPELADELQDLLPTIELLAALGDTKRPPTPLSGPAISMRPEQGELLGDFRILRQLGQGGMGVVYLAEQVSLGRQVALKVLPLAAKLDDRQLTRFVGEARTVATLEHPHIVPVFAVGCEQGVHFYAMQLITGRSLLEVIAEWKEQAKLQMQHSAGAFPSLEDRIRQAAEWTIQAAEALSYSHTQGIVHRDIKPANLLIDDAGKLWVADFGVARALTDCNLTHTGTLVGTPRYMSPEQAGGFQAGVGFPTDIYSLGATLYELVALTPAYPGSDYSDLLRRIPSEPPRPVRELERRVPVDLATIIDKAMRPEPTERYARAQHLADDLGRFLRDEPILARPVTPFERALKWSHRHGSLVRGMAIAAALLLALLTIGVTLVNRARVEAVAALEQKSDLLYATDMAAAYDAWGEGWADEVRTILQRQTPAPGEPDRRGAEWRLLDNLVKLPEPIVLSGHVGAVNEIGVLPGRRLASVGADGTLRIWDLAGGTHQKIPLSSGSLDSVAISPDGRWIAAGGMAIYLCDLLKDCAIRTLPAMEHTIESLVFTPDSQALVAGQRYHYITLLSLEGKILSQIPCESRVESLEFLPHEEGLLVPNRRKWRPDIPRHVAQVWDEQLTTLRHEFGGKRRNQTPQPTIAKLLPTTNALILGCGYDSTAHLIDRDSGAVSSSSPAGRDRLTAVACSPEGASVAVGSADGVVTIMGAETKSEQTTFNGVRQTIQAHRGIVTSVAYLETQRIVTAGSDGLIKAWKLTQPNTHRVRIADCELQEIEFAPNGAVLACVGNQELLLVAERGSVIARKMLSDPVQSIAWSSDGQRVASCSRQSNSVQVFSRTGQQSQAITFPEPSNQVAFAPNGKHLASVDLHAWRLCELKTGRIVREALLDAEGVTLAYSPDGQTIAIGGQFDTVDLCHAGSGALKQRLNSFSHCSVVKFSPNGSVLASGHGDSIIRLWNAASGELLAELTGHRQSIKLLKFSHDSKTLFSASHDGALGVWSVAHGRRLGFLTGATILTVGGDNYTLRHPLFTLTSNRMVIGGRDGDGGAEIIGWGI